MALQAFHFKKFKVEQAGAAHPVGTDAVLLGAWADVSDTKRFLDIGTGTGVVALMLAQRLSESSAWAGTGVELHANSAALARRNFAESPWANQLELWAGAVQDFGELKLGAKTQDSGLLPTPEVCHFDLIVSNPPFFSELTVSPDKTRSLGRHTATLSQLDLIAAARRLLAPKGRFCVVLPEREGRKLCELAVQNGLYWTRVTEVRSRPGKPVERLLLQFERSPYDLQCSEICVYDGASGNGYSAEFRALTGAFYLGG